MKETTLQELFDKNKQEFDNGYDIGFKEGKKESEEILFLFKKNILPILKEMNDVIKSLGEK